jgi:hypothetical protein
MGDQLPGVGEALIPPAVVLRDGKLVDFLGTECEILCRAPVLKRCDGAADHPQFHRDVARLGAVGFLARFVEVFARRRRLVFFALLLPAFVDLFGQRLERSALHQFNSARAFHCREHIHFGQRAGPLDVAQKAGHPTRAGQRDGHGHGRIQSVQSRVQRQRRLERLLGTAVALNR